MGNAESLTCVWVMWAGGKVFGFDRPTEIDRAGGRARPQNLAEPDRRESRSIWCWWRRDRWWAMGSPPVGGDGLVQPRSAPSAAPSRNDLATDGESQRCGAHEHFGLSDGQQLDGGPRMAGPDRSIGMHWDGRVLRSGVWMDWSIYRSKGRSSASYYHCCHRGRPLL